MTRTHRQPVARRTARWPLAVLVAALALCAGTAHGQEATGGAVALGAAAADSSPLYVPDLSSYVKNANDPESLTNSLQILVVLTILTVVPSILLMMTCFVRMLVVLSLLRQAMGTQSLPPSQVVTGLALFLTILVMTPTIQRIHEHAIKPYSAGDMGQLDALTVAKDELRSFMFDQIESTGNEDDVYMMHEYAADRQLEEGEVLQREDVSTAALIPAYMLSELKTSFAIGFRIYLPFLVIDMVIATVLVSMGMMMLPPVLISLPFKLLLFVLADGWHLVVGSLMNSVVQSGGG